MTASAWKEHTCYGCGAVYTYQLECNVSANGPDVPSANQNAFNSVNAPLARHVKDYACPTCGLFQPDMVSQQRYKWHIILLLASCGVTFGAVMLKIGDVLPSHIVTCLLTAGVAA